MSHHSPGIEPASPPSPPPIVIAVEECRICRDTTPPLFPACACKTVVHAQCLRRWLGCRADAHFPLLSGGTRHVCEVCRHPIHADVRRVWHAPTPPPAVAEASGRPMQGKRARVLLLPPALADRAESLCNYLLTVEGCLLIFLAVLAAMGHALFVVGIYRASANDAYSSHRLALASANAVLTVTVLVLVHKMVSRCLREAEGVGGGNSVSPQAMYLATEDGVPTRAEDGVKWTLVGQVVLGVVLSVVAAAEIYLIVQELPLGGLE